jgi:hypothetical protein
MTKELALQNFSGQISITQMLSLIHALLKFHLKKKIKTKMHLKVRAREVAFRKDLRQNTIGLNQTCTVKYLKVILRIT